MKILLIGYGAMSQRVAGLAEEKGHEIVGVIESIPKATTPYQQYQHIADVKGVDVAIDLSNPNLLFPLLDEDSHLSLVVATTGEREKLLNKLDELSQNMPMFFSASMGCGIHALAKILAAAVSLFDDFDIELAEAHHNKKVNASSGTLEKLYDVIVSLKGNVTPVYDRHELNGKRQPQNIGICSIRGGTIVGEHEVLFAGTDETIQITHRVQSKDISTNGAIQAAERLANKPNGFYMSDNL